MAVVESAADGLTLTMPTLGLGLSRNFAQLSSDTDQAQQIQLHNAHHHYHHHLHQHQNLLQLSHIDEDQKGHHINLPLAKGEALTLVNADNHVAVDGIATTKSTFSDSITEKSASSDGITANPSSVNGIASKSQFSEMGKSVAVDYALAHLEGKLGSEDRFLNGASTPLKSMYDQMENIAISQELDGGKAPALANSAHASDGDSLTQIEEDSMRKLEEHLPKLNPLAKEFVPSSSYTHSPSLTMDDSQQPMKKNSSAQGRRRLNGRTSKAQREDSIRRTVYVSDIDQLVTEEQLAALFLTCGPVVDCRVCGDPNSVLRFAFVEFTNEGAARAALGLAGTMLGYYPVRVLPSKTAIVPVNPTFLPCSEDELEMCARTIYCTNIDKKVAQTDVKLFFETLCGEVARLRLLGDYRHSTRIAFVEFVQAECAMAALNCSGAILGSMPLRVSPSKTPVRPRSPRFL